jgi:hypothetical protein
MHATQPSCICVCTCAYVFVYEAHTVKGLIWLCTEFQWESVKTDKHRENYLGHSVKAPAGRWQKGALAAEITVYVYSHFLRQRLAMVQQDF